MLSSSGTDAADFARSLEKTMAALKKEGRRGVWLVSTVILTVTDVLLSSLCLFNSFPSFLFLMNIHLCSSPFQRNL